MSSRTARKQRLAEENLQRIGNIFDDIQRTNMISKPQIHSLIDEFVRDKTNFINGMEQCFLKIIKAGISGSRKTIEKFEKITEKLFQTMYTEASNSKDKAKKIDLEQIYGLFQHFLNFFSQGFSSSNINIKQICGKHIAIMFKVFANYDYVIDQEVLDTLVEGVIFLLKAKQTSLKLLALKIASYIQKFEIEELRIELIKCMTNEENRDVRKVSIINISTDKSSLPYILNRTREVDSELRLIVYKKLTKDKIHLSNLQLADIYKIIYDGLYSREEGVRIQCIDYLKANYYMFNNDGTVRNSDSDNKVDDSEINEISNKKEIYEKTRIEIRRFLDIFQLQKTLHHPNIYDLIELIMQIMVKNIIEPNTLAVFLKEFLRIECKQGKLVHAKPEEIFFLRAVCRLVQTNAKDYNVIHTIIEDNFPSLAEYSKILEKLYLNKDLLSIYQMILLAELMINADETGRQHLTGVLKSFCMNVENEPNVEVDQIENELEEFNDIFTRKSEEDILVEKFSSSYFSTPIIRNTNDLIQIIVRILRALLDDKNNAYTNFLLETISEIKEPIEKSLEGDKNDLISERDTINKHLEQIETEINQVEAKLAKGSDSKSDRAETRSNLRSNSKTPSKIAAALEKQKEKLIDEYENYKQKLNVNNNKIEKISIRCLQIACNLLQTCKFNLNDPGIMGLLSQFIGPCFQNQTQKIRDSAFLCLSIYVLLDKKFCIDYMKVYKEILDRSGSESLPVFLTAIKAIFDFFIYHDLAKQENLTFETNEDETFDCNYLLQKMVGLMFTFHDKNVKKVCVEGFTKLLFNQKLKTPTEYLNYLMIIWINNLKNGTPEIMQLLTMFFRAYTKHSRKGLEYFEESLVIYINVLIEMVNLDDLKFNKEYILQPVSEEIIQTACKIGIELISKNESKTEDEDTLTPTEKFFIFLCKSSLSEMRISKDYGTLLEKNIMLINFENLTPKKKKIFSLYLDHILNNSIDNLESQANNKTIFETLKTKFQSDLNFNDGDLMDIIKKLDDDLINLKAEAHELIKMLKEQDVIMKAKEKQGKKDPKIDNVSKEENMSDAPKVQKKHKKNIESEENEENDQNNLNKSHRLRSKKKESPIKEPGHDQNEKALKKKPTTEEENSPEAKTFDQRKRESSGKRNGHKKNPKKHEENDQNDESDSNSEGESIQRNTRSKKKHQKVNNNAASLQKEGEKKIINKSLNDERSSSDEKKRISRRDSSSNLRSKANTPKPMEVADTETPISKIQTRRSIQGSKSSNSLPKKNFALRLTKTNIIKHRGSAISNKSEVVGEIKSKKDRLNTQNKNTSVEKLNQTPRETRSTRNNSQKPRESVSTPRPLRANKSNDTGKTMTSSLKKKVQTNPAIKRKNPSPSEPQMQSKKMKKH